MIALDVVFFLRFSRRSSIPFLFLSIKLSYLFLGIAWGALNALIETVFPGSFSFSLESDLQNKGSALVYHSFVTLTTLGYGEILPLTRFARTSAYLEAATGVMYCAILVAGLVSNIGRKEKPE